MKQPIDLRPDHAKIVHEIIARHLPAGVSVRVFGSRAKWTAKPHSDLDLALKGREPLPRSVLGDLAEAFSESDLPFRVDVVDWHTVTPSFQAVIDRDGKPLSWPVVSLGELIEVKHGFAFKGEYFSDEPTGDVLVTPGNFAIGGGFQTNKLKFYDGPVADEYVLHPGDVVVTMTDLRKQADTLGYSAIIPKSRYRFLHNQRVGRVLLKSDDADLLFIAWLLRTSAYRTTVIGSATGSTVKHTSPGRILEYRFGLPTLTEQHQIASVLTALDDKIELNRRMNETLEETAQAIFRDWFVDFGPVRRKMAGETDAGAIMGGLTPDPARAAQLASLFPDAFGDDGLPVGWEAAQFGSEFDLTMGQSPPGDTYNDTQDGLPFFQGRTDFGFRYPENRKYCSAPSRIANADDTLISVRAPVGDLNMAWEKCCIGRGVAAARHKSGSVSYTFYWLRALQPELQLYEHTGTVFGAINRKQFEKLPVVRPDLALIAEFERIAGPLDQKIRPATLELRTLAETRDYLLPRLMSGTVRVARESEAA